MLQDLGVGERMIDFKINISQLDEEWLKLPQQYYTITSKLAVVRTALEKAKADLDHTKAQLDADIRSNPDVYGVTGDKLTEPRIERLIALQPEYKNALANYLQLRKKYEILRSVQSALEMKKAALENLVKLYASQYFMIEGLPHRRG